ncbi:MAG: cation:proton antiporter [Bacteroidales bacterium]|nr:cation:proton antiporter [Bacteroidales bacterium]
MHLDPYYIVMGIAILVVFSYVFDWVAKRTNFPSILLLLGVGIILRPIMSGNGIEVPEADLNQYLSVFGIIGLIMIVLEGSLDLEINRKKMKLVGSSFLSALVILLATAFLIAGIIYGLTKESFLICLVNAIPFSVVSSAITIPSVVNLSRHKKEFLTYESTFSDILGIMFFNFIVINEVIDIHAFTGFFGELVILLLISILSTVALMYFMTAIKAHHKFFMIFAILMIIYSIGKMAHLSTLVLIMFFGVVLNNYRILDRLTPGKLRKIFDFPALDVELKFLKSVTAEVAFLIRTMFFVIFGFSFDFALLADNSVWIIGTLIIIAMLGIRFVYLKFTVKSSIFPEIFIAPRGLITILLFFSIPAGKMISGLGQGLLFYVIILSNILMMIGLMVSKKQDNGLSISSIEEARNENINEDVLNDINKAIEEEDSRIDLSEDNTIEPETESPDEEEKDDQI